MKINKVTRRRFILSTLLLTPCAVFADATLAGTGLG